MKIYTKKGDKGFTTLTGGEKVAKNHARIEAYGTVDELIANIGLIYDMSEDQELKKFLLRTEDRLMVCAAILATENKETLKRIPELGEEDVLEVETEIDRLESGLPALKNFILPGGHYLSTACHVARTVCRRAERVITALTLSEEVPGTVLKYLNRLSDYLFVLSRKILKDFKKNDIKWDSK